jgi:hypothetical protein
MILMKVNVFLTGTIVVSRVFLRKILFSIFFITREKEKKRWTTVHTGLGRVRIGTAHQQKQWLGLCPSSYPRPSSTHGCRVALRSV